MSQSNRLKIYVEALIDAMNNNQSKGLMLDLLIHEVLKEMNDPTLQDKYYEACEQLNRKAA